MERWVDADGRLLLRRTEEERAPLLKRLRRAEGQVRGLIEMIETDRYCGDELQQLSAVRAALREVSALLAEQHIEAAVSHSLGGGDTEPLMPDIATVLRRALRL